MAEGRINVRGWLVAQVEPDPGFGSSRYQEGGRLFLFRTATDWTLLNVHTSLRWGSDDRPEEGWASVHAETYAGLDELKAAIVRYGRNEDWRALVKAGAESSDPDPALAALWTPVRIDHDLDKSSVHRRELGVHGQRRREPDWEAEALGLAVARLEEMGFVVLQVAGDWRQVFRRGLGRGWERGGNPIVGALVAAKYGYRAQLVVAVDGAGEVYVRTADANLDPGAPRRYPPRPLNEREWKRVEDLYQRRRSEQFRRLDEERS
jgi:hypothetical protein